MIEENWTALWIDLVLIKGMLIYIIVKIRLLSKKEK